MDPDLLGKIVLARFLELSLRSFSRAVATADADIGRLGLAAWVEIGRLSGSHLEDARQNGPANPTLGRIADSNGVLVLRYARESYIREYRLDEAALEHRVRRAALAQNQSALLGRLRLINTRNRLTDALAGAAIAAQEHYLRSGAPLTLTPLTQGLLSARLRADPQLAVVADEGRVSRLVRRLSLTTADGRIVPFATLAPKPRQVHRHMVESVIREEKSRMLRGDLQTPLTDDAIARILAQDYGVRVLRRSVASIRRDLAIPDSRNRRARMGYVAATEGFSPLLPLTAQTLRACVPDQPGVYEIRANAEAAQHGSSGSWTDSGLARATPTDVVYIGSSSDLRQRLGHHLRGSSNNMPLFQCIARGAARVRYCVVEEAWRAAERMLYEVFCVTFGAPPSFNRMSP
ncbi:GIY-YIG nuclease family protein [Paraburkholderia lycopersici]|nr:GIY-YIG nuclease family protein [Paraburkholderia lycopersici]